MVVEPPRELFVIDGIPTVSLMGSYIDALGETILISGIRNDD